MPVTVDTGKWVPDPDSLGGDPNEFPSGGSGGCDTYNPCKRKMLGSGTFIIKAYVNGKRYADSIHVSVPTLKLTANPKSIEEFRAGKDKAFNALVGQVMKASQGKANPAQVSAILKKKLG